MEHRCVRVELAGSCKPRVLHVYMRMATRSSRSGFFMEKGASRLFYGCSSGPNMHGGIGTIFLVQN